MTAIDRALAVKTDHRMLQALQRAAGVRLSADELLAQRVSFVYGSMDKNSNVTKERVREVILGLTGGTVTSR
jgi:hypothetical protein